MMFRRKKSPGLEALSFEPHVSGVVILNDEIHHVRVLTELLFIDASTWFLAVEDNLLMESHQADAAGDPDTAARLRDIALQIATLVENGRAAGVRGDGVWPHLANRSQLRVWSVKDSNDALRYTKSLLEFADTPEGDSCRADFLLMCSTADDEDAPAAHFFHSPRLAPHARFAGEFVLTHKLSRKLLHSLCEKLHRVPEVAAKLSRCPDQAASLA